MGWWSCDIMGGDTPLDCEDELYSILEVDNRPSIKFNKSKIVPLRSDLFTPEKIEKYIKSLPKFVSEEISIGYQVLAVKMMEVGAPIGSELKDEMIEQISEDEWAGRDARRQKVIDDLLKAVSAYDNKTPIKINSKGLFEVMAEKLKKK